MERIRRYPLHGDRIIALGGPGLRELARDLPATPDTVFPIGSCTKSFTAMAAAIASDEGKLAFDDSPHRYLQTTFGQDQTTTDLDQARRDAALHPLLQLRALYGSVAFAGRAQFDGEDVYVLGLGTTTRLYVSARTALVVRRDHETHDLQRGALPARAARSSAERGDRSSSR